VSRRRKSAEPVNHDRWLVSYADFITLLFAFFVVLFSSSQVDKRKAGKLAAAIQGAFQNLGISQAGNYPLPVVSSDHPPTQAGHSIEKSQGTAERGPAPTAVDKSGGSVPVGRVQLNALQKQLETLLQSELQRHVVVLEAQHEGLVVSLREIGFFESGSAEIRPSSEAAIQRIAAALAAQENNIRIEGHTDNVPIHNARFASNWELSTARATNITRLFVTRSNFPPFRLSAAGYAEFHPAAANSTIEGRATNRRVDIVILPTRPSPADDSPPTSPSPGPSAEAPHQ
jgi:chemotaxis protein MotB